MLRLSGRYCRRSPSGHDPHRFALVWCAYCGARPGDNTPCPSKLGPLWRRICRVCGRTAPNRAQRELTRSLGQHPPTRA